MLLSALLGAAGVLITAAGLRTPDRPVQPPDRGFAAATRTGVPAAAGPIVRRAHPVATSAPAAGPALARSRPVRLEIPRIGVSASLAELGLSPDGSIAVPPASSTAPAGWYRYLAAPGQVGPAVIVGHVDSARDGPAVFFRLGALRPGDRIDVLRADHVVAHFAVTGVVSIPKARFPDDAAYGPVGYPALRLITCGGPFDQGTGHYLDSVIVFARLVGASTPKPAVTPAAQGKPSESRLAD